MPTAALLIIGNEILSGRTQDVHTKFLGEQLCFLGISLQEVRVIRDEESAIVKALNSLSKAYTYVFTTGGIGPTHDDITSASVAKAFKREFILNEEAQEILKNYYKEKLNAARLRMAMMPKDAHLIPNPISAAPGFSIENVFVLAGVPDVMKAMFDHVKPQLNGSEPILSKTIMCYATEGQIASDLASIQNSYKTVEIGSYPFLKEGKIGTSLVLRSQNTKDLDEAYAKIDSFLSSFNKV